MKLSIPRAAMPVVKVLRRDVKKPNKRKLSNYLGCYYFPPRFPGHACPMGLHPKSTDRVPISVNQFAGGACELLAIVRFYRWWDMLTLPEAKKAVDLIWPK